MQESTSPMKSLPTELLQFVDKFDKFTLGLITCFVCSRFESLFTFSSYLLSDVDSSTDEPWMVMPKQSMKLQNWLHLMI